MHFNSFLFWLVQVGSTLSMRSLFFIDIGCVNSCMEWIECDWTRYKLSTMAIEIEKLDQVNYAYSALYSWKF